MPKVKTVRKSNPLKDTSLEKALQLASSSSTTNTSKAASSSSSTASSSSSTNSTNQSNSTSKKSTQSNSTTSKKSTQSNSTTTSKKRSKKSKAEKTIVNDYLLEPFIPRDENGNKLYKTPPKTLDNPENARNMKELFRVYLKYLNDLKDNYDDLIPPTKKQNIIDFTNQSKKKGFCIASNWSTFHNYVKNTNNTITRTDEQRIRNNEMAVKRRKKYISNGMCGHCMVNEVVPNRTKCASCALKTVTDRRRRRQQLKEEGIQCHDCLTEYLEDDKSFCVRCGLIAANKRMDGLNGFQVLVQEKEAGTPICCERCGCRVENVLESVAFTLHHKNYQQGGAYRTFDCLVEFVDQLNRSSAEHFRENEPLELICRVCHGIEHAKNGTSRWAENHRRVLQLFGNKCDCCGITLKEIGYSSLLHIHHVEFDGAKQREEATVALGEGERELSKQANEFKLILKLKGEELEKKLATLQCLCAGCHYFQHMDKHIRGILMRSGNENEMAKVLHKLNRYDEVLAIMDDEKKDLEE